MNHTRPSPNLLHSALPLSYHPSIRSPHSLHCSYLRQHLTVISKCCVYLTESPLYNIWPLQPRRYSSSSSRCVCANMSDIVQVSETPHNVYCLVCEGRVRKLVWLCLFLVPQATIHNNQQRNHQAIKNMELIVISLPPSVRGSTDQSLERI